MQMLEDFKAKARKKKGTIVLPEGNEPRMIHAARRLLDEEICKVIMVGKKSDIAELAKKENVDISGIEISEPGDPSLFEDFANEYYELRKHKGISLEDAKKMIVDPLFWGAMLVKKDMAHASLAGAMNATGKVLKAALHIIGTAPGTKTVSSFFIMVIPEFQGKKDYPIVFADCAVVPQPDPEQLASIATASATSCEKLLGIDPKVAMLSFSTMGSAKHDDADKVLKALGIAKKSKPDLLIDGEIQADAALIDKIGAKKAPGSEVAGQANVLVFPDLDAGNIAYKLVQRLAKAEAVGPVIQGLAKPANDLSRGCSVDDIVNVSAISILLA